MRKLSIKTVLVFVIVLVAMSSTALADGTETLGPTSISIAPGSGVVVAGVGLETQPATLNINVPGTVQQAILYWSGGAPGTGNAGDSTITVNGTAISGTLIGGPTFFFNSGGNPIDFSSYRADVTALSLVGAGANALTVEGMDFGTDENNGAGLLVIYDDGLPQSEIQVRDGIDTAFVNFPGLRQNTVPQVYNFDPVAVERTADLAMFFGSVSSSSFRPTSIEVTIGGVTTLYSNLLSSNDGEMWDSILLSLVIPAGESSITVQAFSRDDAGDSQDPLAASFTWLVGTLSIHAPLEPGIVIKKYTNGEDADTPTGPIVPVGSTVIWTYVVTNSGNVPLNSVVVTDSIEGGAPTYVSGDTDSDNELDLDETWIYTATGIATAGQYANIGYVKGFSPEEEEVNDDDPSHYFGTTPPPPASVGDYVWNDIDEDGIQDDNETPVAGVTVELMTACDGEIISTTVTSDEGLYLFADLTPGQYVVRFTLPDGAEFTLANQSGDPTIDSDANPDTGCTPPIDLEAGENDMTWDAGIVLATPPELAELGDFVWYDLNKNGLQDGGEAGVPGVKVDLYMQGGVFVATQNTDANGFYLFTDLEPGSYYVEFATVQGYSYTHYNVSGNSQDALDSDPLIAWVEVTIGANQEEAELGQPLIYTFFYTNTDTSLAATNVVISTTIPTGTSFVAASSDSGWNCPNTAAGTVCTLTLASLAANTSGSAIFTVLLSANKPDVPDQLDIFASVTQGSLARTEVVTLGPGDSNRTVDAGLVVIQSTLTTPTSTGPTNLPEGEQPRQNQFIYLPTVQSQG